MHQKNTTRVDFPLYDLDMREFMKEEAIGKMDQRELAFYDLFASIVRLKAINMQNHFGILQAGHYTCNVKSGERWYYFDDSRCTLTTEEHVKHPQAYMLFYRRKDLSQLSLQEAFPPFSRLFSGKPVSTPFGNGYIQQVDPNSITPFVIFNSKKSKTIYAG